MNMKRLIGDRADGAQQLAAEVAALKGVLKDISQQVKRIERRIDLVLPDNAKAKTRKVGGGKTSDLSAVQARETVDRMTEELRERKSIRAELQSMTVKHGLKQIARELGMTNTALPPKDELVENIITRLRQTVSLTENIRKIPGIAEDRGGFGADANDLGRPK